MSLDDDSLKICTCGHIEFNHDVTCDYGFTDESGEPYCDCEGFSLKEIIMTREAEIHGRLDAATPPSWKLGKHGRIIGVAQVGSDEDAELIVNAPDDLNYLLDENDDISGKNDRLYDDNADLSEENDNLRAIIIEMEEA